jgi:hypothetical protein
MSIASMARPTKSRNMVGRSENDRSIRVRSLRIERKIEELYIWNHSWHLEIRVSKRYINVSQTHQGLKDMYVCVTQEIVHDTETKGRQLWYR